MARINEIKKQAGITIDSILGSAQSERAQRLKFQIHILIDEAYEAGRQSLVDELVKGKTLGGRK